MGQGTVHDCLGTPQLERLRTVARGAGARLRRGPFPVCCERRPTCGLRSIDQVTYGQFAYNVAEPACFYVLKAEPWDERLIASTSEPGDPSTR